VAVFVCLGICHVISELGSWTCQASCHCRRRRDGGGHFHSRKNVVTFEK
jgi:hypothetical protein